MEFLETKLPEETIQKYPYPLAIAALRVNNSTENVEKFLALGRLAEITLKYLAAIGLAQYLLPEEKKNPEIQAALKNLPKPTLGMWNGILRVCLQSMKEQTDRAVRVPELWQAYDGSQRQDSPVGKAIFDWYHFMSGYLDAKPDGRQSVKLSRVLDVLVDYRNETWGHGVERILAPGFLPRHGEEFLAGLRGVLGALEFLSRYPVRYVKGVRRIKGEEVHVMFDFTGKGGWEQGDPHVGPYAKEERLYVCDAAGKPSLCLFPVFVLHHQRMYVLKYYRQEEGSEQIGYCDCQTGERFAPERLSSFKISKLVTDDQHEKVPETELPIPPQDDGLTVDETAFQPSLAELWPQLDERARQALELGLGEALRIGRFWLGVEFMLMGLSRQSGTLLSELLIEIRLDPGVLRGMLRGIAGVAAADGWERKTPETVGRPAWPSLKEVAGAASAEKFDPAGNNPPVVTPRLLTVLHAAVDLAKGKKLGPDELLAAVLAHPQCLAVKLLLVCFQKAGRDPRDILKRVAERIGAGHPAVPAVPPQNKPVAPAPPPAGNAPRVVAPVAPPTPVDGKASPAAPLPALGGLLGRHGRDLTAEVHAGNLRPAVGADDLLRRIKRILIRRDIRNPLLVGEPGVGKTALVEGLAYDLVHSTANMPKELAGKRIVELGLNSLVAGTRHHGEIEERLEQLIQQVKASPEIIVFIDELHAIMGDRGSGLVLANALKPALARGDFSCIGATTAAEYRRYLEKDAALSRRFEAITVSEPSPDVCVQIAKAHAGKLEGRIAEGAVEAAVHLSARYLPEERLPAKAIKLLDEAAAYVKLPSFGPGGADTEGSQQQPIFTEVNEDLIRYLLSQKTGIPLERLVGDERERIAGIETALKAQVIGQNEAVRAVAQVVKGAYVGVRDPHKPIGVFLFVGPTGVGKTELARSLARFLFHDPSAIIRLDMSEYLERHQVSRLIGAPPGYIGHDEEGQLTGKLRLRPHSVVLLDEIEKAHEDVHNLFLQLFDEGRLTDSKGRTADGREAIFIMTSNVGAEEYSREPVGYIHPEVLSPEWLKEKQDAVEQAVKGQFKPEFRNRMDRVIHFKPLMKFELPAVFDIQFRSLHERLLASHQVTLKATPEAIRYICDRGFDPLNGARPLKRAIQQFVEEPLTDRLLSGQAQAGDTITIDYAEGELRFNITRP